MEALVEAKQERDRQHEPEHAEQQFAARTGKQGGSGKRADVVKHVRRDTDEHTPNGENCRAAITSEVSTVAGVETVEVDLHAKTVTVIAEPFDSAAIVAAIDDAGYEVAA